MIVTCVYVHVKPDAVDSFINATISNHRKSVKEPGNIRFDFIQQADDPCRFMIYEALNRKRLQQIIKTPLIIRSGGIQLQILWQSPDREYRYKIIEPSDRTRW